MAIRSNPAVPLFMACCFVVGCGNSPATDISIERLPDVAPNLPQVPTIPPPPHPITYGDGSFSVYGVRARLNNTVNTDVAITGYIVEIYVPPECPEGEETCPALAPHIWIADTPNEADGDKRVRVTQYADNQAAIDTAIEDRERGRVRDPNECDPPCGEGEQCVGPANDSSCVPAIPTDFAVGAKIKVRGQFRYVSGTGFADSRGLLDYAGHEILEAPPGAS
jgi:hypothetical protein